MDRQSSICGGFCKKSGCERENISPPQSEPEPLIKMKELLEVQGRDGNWNMDSYMQGMYNGMELMVALAEGRDPVFREAPEKWLSKKEWVGLTYADLYFWGNELGLGELGKGVLRAVDAHLREKNT